MLCHVNKPFIYSLFITFCSPFGILGGEKYLCDAGGKTKQIIVFLHCHV